MPAVLPCAVVFPDLLPGATAAGEPAEVPARIGRFASAATRLLLGGDGLTTSLLEAWVGGPVAVRQADHRNVRSAEAPPGADELLDADADETLVVRRSVLASPIGEELSRNLVVARSGLSADVERCLGDPSAPLGAALRDIGIGIRRALVAVGRQRWDEQAAAYKTYVMWHGTLPFAVIAELYNPAVVPADLRPAPAVGGAR
ncbi:hypothetical protein ACPA54_29130 [Uniformispora flossi]|uniref:hypothetical protein n=1 Tax=Uniformispora flossi TaxID=3390723 RepID=UPI003C2EC179